MLEYLYVRQILSVLTCFILSASFSGVSGLIVYEPCAVTESAPEDSDSCPPTCAQCGCCAQPVLPLDLPAERADDLEILSVIAATTFAPQFSPRDVFHVPKPALC